jgi:hypothetical protein
MKLLRIVIGASVGFAVATFVCWGGLYLFGVLVLRGKESLFDASPHLASLFFAWWFVSSSVAAVICGCAMGGLSRQNRKKRFAGFIAFAITGMAATIAVCRLLVAVVPACG